MSREDRDWFTAAEVGKILGADPQTIRMTARKSPERLGFRVICIGQSVRIPKEPFLKFMKGE